MKTKWQRHLFFQAVVALFGDVNDEEDGGSEMCQSSDRVHFDRVPFLEWLVEDSGRVNDLRTTEVSQQSAQVKASNCVADLPSQVLVVCVTDVERLRRERVRLHLHFRSSQFIHQGRFPDIREATNYQSPKSKFGNFQQYILNYAKE